MQSTLSIILTSRMIPNQPNLEIYHNSKNHMSLIARSSVINDTPFLRHQKVEQLAWVPKVALTRTIVKVTRTGTTTEIIITEASDDTIIPMEFLHPLEKKKDVDQRGLDNQTMIDHRMILVIHDMRYHHVHHRARSIGIGITGMRDKDQIVIEIHDKGRLVEETQTSTHTSQVMVTETDHHETEMEDRHQETERGTITGGEMIEIGCWTMMSDPGRIEREAGVAVQLEIIENAVVTGIEMIEEMDTDDDCEFFEDFIFVLLSRRISGISRLFGMALLVI